MRICTDHNDVYASAIHTLSDGTDVNGHLYIIQAGSHSTIIEFQRGAVKEAGVNGVTSEALLEILIHRTQVLNERFPCEENAQALAAMKVALGAFHLRTARRVSRGVEGVGVA